MILVKASDSDDVYDAEPGQDNDLQSAVDKFKVMTWLWQALVDDFMYKNSYGHRSFIVQEEENEMGDFGTSGH